MNHESDRDAGSIRVSKMPANRFAIDLRVRAGIAVAIGTTCVAIVLYQIHHRRQLLAYSKANTAHAKHTAQTARAFLRKYQSTSKQQSDKCSQDCLSALWLVAETLSLAVLCASVASFCGAALSSQLPSH